MSNNAHRLAEIDRKYAYLLPSLSEGQKADLGLPYVANEPALVRARLKARRLFLKYNQTPPSDFDPPDLPIDQTPQGIGGSNDDGEDIASGVGGEERRQILAELLGVDQRHLQQVEIEVR